MKIFVQKIGEQIRLHKYQILTVILSLLCLLSYYFIDYSRTFYQIIVIFVLFIPVIIDVMFKIKSDKQNQNYYEIHNFSLMRLYMIFVVPTFVGIHTNWYIVKNITDLRNLALLTIYILAIVLVNLFVLKYQTKSKRSSDLDNTINLIIYLVILGLVLIAK